ncbi:uncharacterized protein LOC144619810 isoform X1 [Crassostrea virginica]
MAIFSTFIGVNILILCMDLPMSAMEANSSGCAQGFYGPSCMLPCRFPTYGNGCQLECNCSMTLCNHITGCPNPATETTTGNNSETHRGRSVPDDPQIPNIVHASNNNLTSLKGKFCLFQGFSSHTKIFHSYEDVTICFMFISGFHSFVLIKVISFVGDGLSYFLLFEHSLRVAGHSC